MKLIKPSYKIIEQNSELNGIYEAIESAGRTCYKSIGTRYFKIPLNGDNVPDIWHTLKLDTLCDKYIKTEGDGLYPHCLNGYVSIADKNLKYFPELVQYESEFNPNYHKNITAKDFVDRMIKSGHLAMLEFGTVYLKFYSPYLYGSDYYIYHKYESNPYSKVTIKSNDIVEGNIFITTNYRVLIENNWLDDLCYLCSPTEFHEKRICVRFTTDRGISHELVRHRKFSFAQESTRYCNYSKDKFGKELTFIIPSWVDIEEGKMNTDSYGCPITRFKNNEKAYFFLSSLGASERAYTRLLNCECTPQQARQVLPNALKTEINMCGFVNDWKHFFNLRDNSHAHPDMQDLVKPLHQEFINKEYII
jgi:thymidylate synthase (FAD)